MARGHMGGTIASSFGVPCPEYWPLGCRGAIRSFAPFSLSCAGGQADS